MPANPNDPVLANSGRRGFIGTAAASAAGVALAASVGRKGTAQASPAHMTDLEVLNFALNLEYVEAEYYVRAVTGAGLPSSLTATGKGKYGGVISTPATPKVTFTSNLVEDLANELAQDEMAHVAFLRSALGSAAYSEPVIDIGNAFNTAAQAAGIGNSFDPYASEANFLLGGFIFEDVGVTAYHGGATLITNLDYLSAAAGILGTEAYHAGAIRATLIQMAQGNPSAMILKAANAISNLRDSLDGPKDDDQGLNYKGSLNYVPVDSNSITFARTTTQVLKIVYGNTTPEKTKGLFFPDGLNGKIS